MLHCIYKRLINRTNLTASFLFTLVKQGNFLLWDELKVFDDSNFMNSSSSSFINKMFNIITIVTANLLVNNQPKKIHRPFRVPTSVNSYGSLGLPVSKSWGESLCFSGVLCLQGVFTKIFRTVSLHPKDALCHNTACPFHFLCIYM